MVRVRSPTEIHKKINLRLKERFGLESELCENRNPYHVNLPLVVNCGPKKNCQRSHVEYFVFNNYLSWV